MRVVDLATANQNASTSMWNCGLRRDLGTARTSATALMPKHFNSPINPSTVRVE